MSPTAVTGVFFDVDFTLIYPGPAFQGSGYRDFCRRHGVQVDPARFGDAVKSASSILDEHQEHVYDPEVFVRYTRRIIEGMGGAGAGVDPSAREIYAEWAACRHFELYYDVIDTLHQLARRRIRIGLISNSHRDLEEFGKHFELAGLVTVAVSSAAHGYLKPHPSIFETALRLAGVAASEALMVGDSVSHDIEGARRAGMRAVLIHRSATPTDTPPDVTVVRRLDQLLELV